MQLLTYDRTKNVSMYLWKEKAIALYRRKSSFVWKVGLGGEVRFMVLLMENLTRSDSLKEARLVQHHALPSSIETEHTFPASTCTQSTRVHHMDMGLATQTYLHNRVRCMAWPDKFTQQDTICTQLALFVSLSQFSHSSFSPNHCYPSFFQLLSAQNIT